MAVADAGILVRRVDPLGRRHRLAGQGGFLDAQVGGFEQAQVGGHTVAAAQADDVAGHKRAGIDLPPLAVTTDMGLDREHLADPLQGLLGLALLEKTDDGVDAHHPENDAGVHPVAEHGGNEPGGEQDVDEQVMEMFEEPLEETFPGRRRQAVRADIFQSAFGLVSGQSGGRGGQLGEDGLGRQAVERSAGQAGGCFLVHEQRRSLSQGGVVCRGTVAGGAADPMPRAAANLPSAQRKLYRSCISR